MNPDAQQLVADEFDSKLEGDAIDYDKLNQLKYLDAFYHESLRLLPSGVRVERKAINDCYLGGAFLPKGTYVTIPVHAIHRDPDNYDQPDEFKIERFLPENKRNIKPGTFLPFADGPRNCLGFRLAVLMVKVTLVRLLRKYKIVATDKTAFVPHSGRVVNMPKQMMVKMEKRNVSKHN